MAPATKKTEEAKTFTPSEIADATGADPKAIRAYLRSNFSREAAMKGKSWSIDAEVAAKVIEHFTASEDEDEGTEENILESDDLES